MAGSGEANERFCWQGVAGLGGINASCVFCREESGWMKRWGGKEDERDCFGVIMSLQALRLAALVSAVPSLLACAGFME